MSNRNTYLESKPRYEIFDGLREWLKQTFPAYDKMRIIKAIYQMNKNRNEN